MKNYNLDFGSIRNNKGNYDIVNSYTDEYIPCNCSFEMADIYLNRIYNGDIVLLRKLKEMYKCIKLEGIQKPLPAKRTRELKINDVIIWNYGYKSQVIEIKQSKTGKSYKVLLKSLEDGFIRERTLRAETLVAIK